MLVNFSAWLLQDRVPKTSLSTFSLRITSNKGLQIPDSTFNYFRVKLPAYHSFLMATEHENIAYECSKRSATSDDNKDYLDDDLRVIAVIENQTSVTKRDGDCEAQKIYGSGKETTVKSEVIHLDEASTARTVNRNDDTLRSRSYDNPRVIELSDNKSKMELRRQFKVDITSHELSSGITGDSRTNLDADHYGNADILSRLPPGTILIKQSSSCSATAATLGTTRVCSREDSDYVHDSSKESTGTNSSESSGAASYTALAAKVKRIQYRTVRSKKIVQVRRNPARNKKKKPTTDEDFSQRSRQRLLAVKRKASTYVVDPTARKRARSVPTPYMNTRSVTRKMYNVGATYQAPTVHDAIEWKEWPSHGMHERPVWHPQIGLAYEYNRRTFMSLDGQTYREIIDEPIIEVVSVDPHPERTSMAYGRRSLDRVRPHSSVGTLEMYDKSQSVDQVHSFQACMHESLHSVLAYCARVVTPTYKKTVDAKLQGFSQAEQSFDHAKSDAKPTILTDIEKAPQESNKMGTPSLLVPTSSVTNKIPESSDVPSTSGDVPKCLVVPRKTIHFTNVRNIQGNILQEVFNRSSKNTLIFLKPTDPPGKTAEKIAAALKNSSAKIGTAKSKDQTSTDSATVKLNLTKLDDNAISDEALMEMSSMYNTLLPIEDVESNFPRANRPANYIANPVTAVVATKISKSSSESSLQENPKNNSEPVHQPRFAYSNQAAEIAKILADYNQKPSKNSGLRNACYASASSVLNVRAMTNVTMVKPSINTQESRNTFLSIVEQPKKIKLKREECLDYRIVVRQECSKNSPENAITPEEKKMVKNDDIEAMDLTTAKSREFVDDKPIADKSDDSCKWLQELIQDTALLYCAACGVHQDDVAEYFNTLDSAQSIQWLGS